MSEQQTETIYERIRREGREREQAQRERARQIDEWKKGETNKTNAQWNK